jgi:hypothetical protein
LTTWSRGRSTSWARRRSTSWARGGLIGRSRCQECARPGCAASGGLRDDRDIVEFRENGWRLSRRARGGFNSWPGGGWLHRRLGPHKCEWGWGGVACGGRVWSGIIGRVHLKRTRGGVLSAEGRGWIDR